MKGKIRITPNDFEQEIKGYPTEGVFYLIFSGLMTTVSLFEIFYFLLTIDNTPYEIYNFALSELIFSFPSFLFFAAGLFGYLTKKRWTRILNYVFLPIYSMWRFVLLLLMIPDPGILNVFSSIQIKTFISISILIILACEYFTIYFISEKSRIHLGR